MARMTPAKGFNTPVKGKPPALSTPGVSQKMRGQFPQAPKGMAGRTQRLAVQRTPQNAGMLNQQKVYGNTDNVFRRWQQRMQKPV